MEHTWIMKILDQGVLHTILRIKSKQGGIKCALTQVSQSRQVNFALVRASSPFSLEFLPSKVGPLFFTNMMLGGGGSPPPPPKNCSPNWLCLLSPFPVVKYRRRKCFSFLGPSFQLDFKRINAFISLNIDKILNTLPKKNVYC